MAVWLPTVVVIGCAATPPPALPSHDETEREPSAQASRAAAEDEAGRPAPEDPVAGLEARRQQIDDALASYVHVTADVFEFSTEGGVLEAYADGKAVVKVTLDLYGELGRAQWSFYYEGGAPFCVVKVRGHYDRHIVEGGGEVVRTDRERFLLHDGRIVRWEGGMSDEVTRQDPQFARTEAEILTQARQVLARAQQALAAGSPAP
jgi:hypothetical protein